jgi:magnesium transporter
MNENETKSVESSKPNYGQEIIDIIQSTITPIKMQEKLSDYHESDIADVMMNLSATERRKLYHVLDLDVLADIIEYMDPAESMVCVNELDIRRLAKIISKMETDDAIELLKNIEKDKRQIVLELLDTDAKKDIALVASYDEDEIGSKMITNFIEIPKDYSVVQAMKSLIEQASENDNISTLFVIDENKAFYGAIDLRELIIARKDSSLEDLIMTSYPYVYGHEQIDDIIEKIKDYSEDSIPVLSDTNEIQGIITSQNLVQVVDEEMSEDYAKLAGLSAEEDLNEPVLRSVSKRLPWLVVLLFLSMFVSSVVGSFEQVVSTLPLIMAFQSMILDMAGNVGTQSLAVTIRVLTDESLSGKEKAFLFFKETRIGFFDGIILGLISIIVVGLYIFLFKNHSLVFAYSISGCIGLAMLASMVISSATGTLVPLLFQKLGIDPAVASGPLITTINDLTAVCTYYSLCWIMLIHVLHLA